MAEKVFRLPKLVENGANYESWKKDIELWCLASKLEPRMQAIAIHLSLDGKARAATSELDLKNVLEKEAVKGIKDKLDKLFLPEKGIRQFNAFCSMFNLRRKDEGEMMNFICEFEHTIFQFKQQGMELPDPVMAFMLLASCNLSESDSHLVMTGVREVTYESMRAALLRVFGHKFSASNTMQTVGNMIELKTEPTFCTESSQSADETFYARGRYAGRRRGGRARGGAARGNWRSFGVERTDGDRRQNPLGADGRVTKCAVCSSMMHWARDCPHSYENSERKIDKEDNQGVNFSALVGCTDLEDGEKLRTLVKETKGCAILDSACCNTVCGESWLSSYVNNLSDLEKAQVEEKISEQTFTFGDGRSFSSERKVTLPCYIGGLKGEITTDVVKCDIPLLLGIKSMKKLGMKLDFGKDYLFFHGMQIKLNQLKSGHYYLTLSQ